jgi:hypothetical protein
MPGDDQQQPILTDEEGAVIGLLIAHGGLTAAQLKPLLDRHFGNVLDLNLRSIDAILATLSERGLIAVASAK